MIHVGSAYGAVDLKCDKKQAICEVSNRRLTVGDWVGFFSKDGYLSALGKIVKIKGRIREIRIKKSFAHISKHHRVEIVKDKHARKPRKYFRVRDRVTKSFWGVNLSLVSMGVGSGFPAFSVSGNYFWKFRKGTYFLARSWFLNGSGETASSIAGNPPISVSLSSLGVIGGISEIMRVGEKIALFPYIAGGFSFTSVEVGSTEDASEALNNRVKDGILLALEGGLSAYYRWGDYFPTIGVNILSLHDSVNIGLSGGITVEL